MVKIETVIKSLSGANVDYVIVGGIAVKSHSSSYVTYDFDFCYRRSENNLNSIFEALAPFQPRPRDFLSGLPFVFDRSTLRNGTNFTFETTVGDIDLLGEIAGIGSFEAVLNQSESIPLYGFEVKILTLEVLLKPNEPPEEPRICLFCPNLKPCERLWTTTKNNL